MRFFISLCLVSALLGSSISPEPFPAPRHLATTSFLLKPAKSIQQRAPVLAYFIFIPLAESDTGNVAWGAILLVSLVAGTYWYFKVYLPRHPEIGKILNDGWVQMKHRLGESTGMTTRRNRPLSNGKLKALEKAGFPAPAAPKPAIDVSL